MGASESSLSSSQKQGDEITTITTRSVNVDPILEKLNSLKITTPILTSAPTTEGSLTDILVRKPSSSSSPGTINPKVLLELFSMYREWQEEKAEKISKRQEEIENKIEVVDALAIKLLQRFNYSASSMKTSSHQLSEVHALKVEIGELKGRLTEVMSNCDALCKRITSEGPESLLSSIKPLAVMTTESNSVPPPTAQHPQNYTTPNPDSEQTAVTTAESETSSSPPTAEQPENIKSQNPDTEHTD